MAKMTKTQARKRLNESIMKMSNVFQYGQMSGILSKSDLQKLSMAILDLHNIKKKFE